MRSYGRFPKREKGERSQHNNQLKMSLFLRVKEVIVVATKKKAAKKTATKKTAAKKKKK